MKTVGRLLLAASLIASGHGASKALELANDEFRLTLGLGGDQIPCIEAGHWLASGQRAFQSDPKKAARGDWLPGALAGANRRLERPWSSKGGSVFREARCSQRFGDLLTTWHVDLAKQGSTFRTYISLANRGTKQIKIDWFPVWMGDWALPGEDSSMGWWDALSYGPHGTRLSPGREVRLSSQTYSSDRRKTQGHVPFWHLANGKGHLFFNLAWSGGWQATISRRSALTCFRVLLPPEETQLVLKPGEEITGPILYISAIEATGPAEARARWFQQRRSLAEKLYRMPKPWFPLVYNHWYSVRAHLTEQFIRDQLDQMKPYGFDVFVLDDGWFEKVGDWRPARDKFRPGGLERAFAQIRQQRIKAGIWSCPWLQAVEGNDFPPEIDQPRFYRKYMNAYSLDLVGIDFRQSLVDHIGSLKRQFHIDWWKYDQELFGQGSRHGKMKKVIALQDALRAVRQSYPDLHIENCMSGGRMINGFTDAISQIHWIRDGGHTGLAHARSNVQEALGAAQFLPPYKVQRWTNRPNELDPAGEELLRLYCRSAMIGVWGISADMAKIGRSQRRVILGEIEHYRRLGELKSANRYEILYPRQGKKIAGIIFYDSPPTRAAAVLFRWQDEGTIADTVPFAALPKDRNYAVTDADSNNTLLRKGRALAEQGLTVSFGPIRYSGIYWVGPAD